MDDNNTSEENPKVEEFPGATLGFFMGVFATAAGLVLGSFLSWDFSWGMFQVRLILVGGIIGMVIGIALSP
jgi:hypothetical protein